MFSVAYCPFWRLYVHQFEGLATSSPLPIKFGQKLCFFLNFLHLPRVSVSVDIMTYVSVVVLPAPLSVLVLYLTMERGLRSRDAIN